MEIRWHLIWLLAISLSGCGYRLMGTPVQAPGGIRSISVGEFENHSREIGLDKRLAFALEREFYRRGTLRVMEDPTAGEGVIVGTIQRFNARPVAFDANDEARQYEAELTLDVTLRRQDDGAVLWEGVQLRAVEEYAVARNFVVPSSSQFQQGTLDFGNLKDLTDIQLAETEKRLAIERLVTSIVRDVHDRIFDDF